MERSLGRTHSSRDWLRALLSQRCQGCSRVPASTEGASEMRILPRDIGEWIICAMLVCVIWFGVTAIRARLTIPDPQYYWYQFDDHITTQWWGNKVIEQDDDYQHAPLAISEQHFYINGKSTTCIIDANDDLWISNPSGFHICYQHAMSCTLPTGEVCTRTRR